MAVGLCKNDIIDFQTIDDVPVRLLFMIAAAYTQHAYYLQTLSFFSTGSRTRASRGPARRDDPDGRLSTADRAGIAYSAKAGKTSGKPLRRIRYVARDHPHRFLARRVRDEVLLRPNLKPAPGPGTSIAATECAYSGDTREHGVDPHLV
jgi:hypothetical protein